MGPRKITESLRSFKKVPMQGSQDSLERAGLSLNHKPCYFRVKGSVRSPDIGTLGGC